MSSPTVDTQAIHHELKTRWDSMWERLHITPRTGLFETMMSRWGEPQRHYHTAHHLLECLRCLDDLAHYAQDSRPIEFAIWYHRAFYNTETQTNEEKSAELALRTFVKSGGSSVVGLRIRDLVLATTHRLPVRTHETALMVDSVLWILGAPPDRFDQHEMQVRAEHPRVTNPFFAQARIRLLEAIRARESIYRTPFLRDKQEGQARLNIQRSLKALVEIS